MKNQKLTTEEKYLTGELYKLKENVEEELLSKYGLSTEKLRKGLLVHNSYNKEINGEDIICYECYYPTKIELPKSFVEKFFEKNEHLKI